jgi:hypothetical protein
MGWLLFAGSASAEHVMTFRDARIKHAPGEVSAVDPIGFRTWTLKVTLKTGSKWVFRPEENWHNAGLTKIHGIAQGTLSVHERAFYLTSRHLRLGVVPQVVRGELDGVRGTFQRFVEDGYHTGWHAGGYLGEARAPVDVDSLQAVAILHYVTHLVDGHEMNRLAKDIAGKTRRKAIDGELTFGEGRTASFAIQEVLGQELSPKLKRRFGRVHVDAWRADLLKEGLTDVEIDGAVKRFARVREHGLAALTMPD